MAEKLGKILAKFSAWTTPTGDSGIAAKLGGESTAVGTDTLADGDTSLVVKDLGAVTVVRGTATFSATAKSPEGTQSFATANGFVEISGADYVFTKTTTKSRPDKDGGDSTWSETSTTSVIAIDIEGITLPKVVSVSEGKVNSLIKSLTMTKPDKDANSWPDPVDPDGNVATVDVDVHVVGENTYAEVESSVLAVEDTLSTVNALITAGLA
jgi:hypothetical protein